MDRLLLLVSILPSSVSAGCYNPYQRCTEIIFHTSAPSLNALADGEITGTSTSFSCSRTLTAVSASALIGYIYKYDGNSAFFVNAKSTVGSLPQNITTECDPTIGLYRYKNSVSGNYEYIREIWCLTNPAKNLTTTIQSTTGFKDLMKSYI